MLTAVTQTPPPHHRGLTQDAELGVGADVLVAVGSRAAVAARVVVGDAADDQVGAEQQRELLVPAQKDRRGSAGRPPPAGFGSGLGVCVCTHQLWMSSWPFRHWMLGAG